MSCLQQIIHHVSFSLGKKRESLSQREKQNKTSRQAKSNKQDVQKESGIPGEFVYNSFLSPEKTLAFKVH